MPLLAADSNHLCMGLKWWHPHPMHQTSQVLVMTVSCGFGGQPFQAAALDKVQVLRVAAPALNIQVDGGIKPETARMAGAAGANVAVAGTAVFGAEEGPLAAVAAIRAALLEGLPSAVAAAQASAPAGSGQKMATAGTDRQVAAV